MRSIAPFASLPATNTMTGHELELSGDYEQLQIALWMLFATKVRQTNIAMGSRYSLSQHIAKKKCDSFQVSQVIGDVPNEERLTWIPDTPPFSSSR